MIFDIYQLLVIAIMLEEQCVQFLYYSCDSCGIMLTKKLTVDALIKKLNDDALIRNVVCSDDI